MITREEIRYIPELHKSIKRDKEHLRYLREKATCIPSMNTESERVQSSPSNHGNIYVEEAVDLAKVIKKKQEELEALQSKAESFIATVEGILPKKILTLRYIRCYSWDIVADLVGYDERYIRRIEYQLVSDLALPCPHGSSI